MKITDTCYRCLTQLVYQAAGMATEDECLRETAVREGLKTLEESFSGDKVSIVVATALHDAIKNSTGNPDPYRELKRKEIELAGAIYRDMKVNVPDDFYALLKLAAKGNILDFFRPLDTIKEEMEKDVVFAIDDTERLEEKIKEARYILFLADNAGEMFFDLPLLKWMRHYARAVYVVKAGPVQNDITREEIAAAGLKGEFGEVMDTGTATPGIDFGVASRQFINAFNSADLVFAKGMGYYESLSEIPAYGRVFHCLVAKCQPVADSIGVALNSAVAMLR